MSLAPGTKLGPYEIVAPVGAGGMGEVYRALDPRLDRTVAIKILPAHLASNPEAKERFEREAKSISALQHGSICSLYDVGSQNGVSYLVMEYLEGETLADRLRKGCLPLEQVLRHGGEICDGLERAHRIGLVHRDLKPGNIMLTRSGAKLMDFGLAKPVAAATQSSTELTQTLSTATHPLTAEGSIVGTFQYMSPEQVEGKNADARSDIFSLGTVLYEMATGRRAFEGKSMVSIAAAILEKDPEPLTTVQPLSPASLQHVVEGCLVKDPESRWQSAGDVGRQLRWIGSSGSHPGVAVSIRKSSQVGERLIWSGALLLVIALGAFLLQSRPQHPVLKAHILPPPGATFDFTGDFSGPPVLSPDGSRLAFTVQLPKQANSLWVRSLDSATAQRLAGTEGASDPFWSADNRFLGFFSDSKLKRISADGGPVTVLADAPNARGGTWGTNNVILYSPDYRDSLWQVNPDGGAAPTRATKLDGSKHSTHRWPVFMPDGKHFIFFATSHSGGAPQQNGIYFSALGDENGKLVLASDSAAQYAGGYLLFHQQNSVVAQRFDPQNGGLSGDQQVIVDQVQYDGGTWHTTFAAAASGVLLYEPGLATTENSVLVWLDRNGKSVNTLAAGITYKGMRLSPDGKRLALAAGDPLVDIWVWDLAHGTRMRLTFDPATHIMPSWSLDGRTVAYVAQGSSFTGSDLHSKAANGSGQDELLLPAEFGIGGRSLLWPEWSSDKKYLVYQEQAGPVGGAIWAMPLAGDRKPFPVVRLVSPQGSVTNHRVSPDSRWIAYSARESSREEVYITSFPSGKGRWQISSEGGTFPVWRGDGKELYFVGDDGQLRAVEIKASAGEISVGHSQVLFPLRNVNALFAPFDVTADGQRFLVGMPLNTQSEPLLLVSDWTAALKK
jgi:serine/threonine protein kinase